MQTYDPEKFWEKHFSAYPEITDKSTIGNNWTDEEVEAHYNFIEKAIFNTLTRTFPKHPARMRILDLGSGAGHWIQYFSDLFLSPALRIIGYEISDTAVRHLCIRFQSNTRVLIWNGDITKIDFPGAYIINAIGIMHHIVSDEKLVDLIIKLDKALEVGGFIFIGSRFSETKTINKYKRYRSVEWWKDTLEHYTSLTIHKVYLPNKKKGLKTHLELMVLRREFK